MISTSGLTIKHTYTHIHTHTYTYMKNTHINQSINQRNFMLQLYYYLVESRDINCWVYDKVSRKEKQIETERERQRE